MQRPDFKDINSGAEFNRWYWLKQEMVEICRHANLPTTGRKFVLRDRIMYALDNNGKVAPEPVSKKKTSKFNWAKSELTLNTIITDNISFGQNLRRFMKSQVDRKFSFNTEFMDWAKNNAGKTLKDAVDQWLFLEDRKKSPDYKSTIADNNMYNQYMRDFMNDNPNFPIKEVRKYWLKKRQLPTNDGFIRYDKSDLKL